MKRTLILLSAGIVMLSLSACTLSRLKAPRPQPTPASLSTPTAPPATPAPTASPTPLQPTAVVTQSLPTPTPNPAAATAIPGGAVPTAASGVILPGLPSGPYGVIRVAHGGCAEYPFCGRDGQFHHREFCRHGQ